MMQHPQNIPVVQYYELNGVAFSYCWRAGSTSIATLALNNNAKVLEEPPERCVLLLKHPMERFGSSYIILPEVIRRKPDGEKYVGLPELDLYIDGVLDDVEGVRSPHNWPQMGQHAAVKMLEIFRLEGSTFLAGAKLPHMNSAEREKPLLAGHPRETELHEFYADDIKAWDSAQPLTELVYPAGVGK